jgi:hypothetical protein
MMNVSITCLLFLDVSSQTFIQWRTQITCVGNKLHFIEILKKEALMFYLFM